MNSPHHDTARALIEGSPVPGGDDFQNTAVRGSSRRTLLKGAAWSVPVIAMAADAPAYAASNEAPFGILFDGGGGANGYLNSVYLDLGIARTSSLTSYTLIEDLVVTIDVIGLSGPAANQRSFTAGSDYGTLSRGAYNSTTRTTSLTWILPAGTVMPRVSTGTNVPDILFSFQDGATGSGRVTNKIVVTSIRNGYITDPAGPPLDSSVVKDQNRSAVSPDGIY